MSRIDESRPFLPVRIAVLTVSDTRTVKEDKSGTLLASLLTEAGHELAAHEIVRDEIPEIQAKVQGWIDDPAVDVVLTTGGTGFTGRDVTPEAVRPLFEKEIDGVRDVLECHHVTGQHTLILKVKTRNTETLERLIDQIRAVDGVTRTETQVVLSTFAERTDIAVEAIGVPAAKRGRRQRARDAGR